MDQKNRYFNAASAAHNGQKNASTAQMIATPMKSISAAAPSVDSSFSRGSLILGKGAVLVKPARLSEWAQIKSPGVLSGQSSTLQGQERARAGGSLTSQIDFAKSACSCSMASEVLAGGPRAFLNLVSIPKRRILAPEPRWSMPATGFHTQPPCSAAVTPENRPARNAPERLPVVMCRGIRLTWGGHRVARSVVTAAAASCSVAK